MTGYDAEPEVLEGYVEVRVVAAGSKSEAPQVVLAFDGAPPDAPPLVLRRRGWASLALDPDLAAYEGQRVRVVGSRALATFVVDGVEVVS